VVAGRVAALVETGQAVPAEDVPPVLAVVDVEDLALTGT
jgi:hypothetical protein